jgi:hypothetical protein
MCLTTYCLYQNQILAVTGFMHKSTIGQAVEFYSCFLNSEVTGSISDGVTGIFHCHNPSDRIMALGLTRPLTEMSTRNIS